MQFAHFGVLNDGNQSKTSLFTSITLNIIIALCVIIISAAAKTHHARTKLTSISLDPVKKVEPEPIKPKIVPKIPPPPPVAKVEPPKIKLPDVKLPDPPKTAEVKMTQPAAGHSRRRRPSSSSRLRLRRSSILPRRSPPPSPITRPTPGRLPRPRREPHRPLQPPSHHCRQSRQQGHVRNARLQHRHGSRCHQLSTSAPARPPART